MKLLEVLRRIIKESSAATLVHQMPYKIKDEGMFRAAYFGKSALRFRIKRYPHINEGDPVYELHLDLAPEDQGKGLAAKMVKVFLYKEGGVGWISYGRITNPQAYKVIDKLKLDRDWEVEESENGYGVTVQER